VPEEPSGSSAETHENNQDGPGVGGEEGGAEQQRSGGEQQKSGGDLNTVSYLSLTMIEWTWLIYNQRVSNLEETVTKRFKELESKIEGFKSETRGYFYFLISIVFLGVCVMLNRKFLSSLCVNICIGRRQGLL